MRQPMPIKEDVAKESSDSVKDAKFVPTNVTDEVQPNKFQLSLSLAIFSIFLGGTYLLL